jgi:hypothetical protein
MALHANVSRRPSEHIFRQQQGDAAPRERAGEALVYDYLMRLLAVRTASLLALRQCGRGAGAARARNGRLI